MSDLYDLRILNPVSAIYNTSLKRVIISVRKKRLTSKILAKNTKS